MGDFLFNIKVIEVSCSNDQVQRWMATQFTDYEKMMIAVSWEAKCLLGPARGSQWFRDQVAAISDLLFPRGIDFFLLKQVN